MQKESDKEFTLTAGLEIVIIHTDGKSHQISKKGEIISKFELAETRMLVSPELLQNLITELQLHQKKLEAYRNNADQINSLIKHISTT